MSRNRGTFPFSANFEGNLRGPIDAKMLVSLKSDLIDPSTWINSGLEWTYVGMPVSVSSDPVAANNGMYVLNGSDYTSSINWVKLGSGSDASLNALYAYERIQDASIMRLYSSETVSRTIYVDASGSDITGDGSVLSLPYATIGKALSTVGRDILSGITTTVNIGTGTFAMNASDLNTLRLINGAGTLTLQGGSMVLCASNFTMGSAQPLDPLTYAVSGGDTSTWVNNNWKYYYLKSGTSYYPITHDTSITLSVTAAVTGTEIYQLPATTINISGTTLENNTALNFTNLNVNFLSDLQIYNVGGLNNNIIFTNCNFSGDFEIDINSGTCYRINRCNSNTTNYNLRSSANLFNNNYFYKSAATYILNLFPEMNKSGNHKIYDNVYENPLTNANSMAIYINGDAPVYTTSTSYLKFVNTYACMKIGGNTNLQYNRTGSKIIMVDCSLFLRKFTSALEDFMSIRVNVNYNNIYGIPKFRWFWESMYEFVNLASGRNIQITGLIYPEFEQNQSFKLVNNTTTDISIGQIQQNKSIHVDYTLNRSIGTAAGAFNIMIDNSALTTSIDRYTYSGTIAVADPAITFDAILDSSIVKLRSTLDSSGGDASIYYNISRVMRTPLTI